MQVVVCADAMFGDDWSKWKMRDEHYILGRILFEE
jgi:hypothetical protein